MFFMFFFQNLRFQRRGSGGTERVPGGTKMATSGTLRVPLSSDNTPFGSERVNGLTERMNVGTERLNGATERKPTSDLVDKNGGRLNGLEPVKDTYPKNPIENGDDRKSRNLQENRTKDKMAGSSYPTVTDEDSVWKGDRESQDWTEEEKAR